MSRRRGRLAAAGAALCLLAAACGPGASAGTDREPLLVAAAADLLPAFTELGETFEERTGQPVVFTFGSSGHLAQQVVEGAPVDLYASASSAFVQRVLDAGVGDASTRVTYAHGRVALWSTAETWGGWRDLRALAADPAVRTVAIANPEHAPYGLAARQALEAAGVWEAVRPRLVYGEHVADAHRLVASGNADAGLVALPLALASEDRGEGRWVPVDGALHEPLRQELIVITRDPDRAALARRFADHVTSGHGREVLRRSGFMLEGEDERTQRRD